MADVIKLVKDDNLPEVTLTLTDTNTGSPIDLSASTTSVNVYFRAVGSTTVLSTLACSKVSGGADGVVKFYFPGSALNVASGPYEGEIEINFNGLKQTVYDVLKFKVREDF
mgnify:CR=1 FL=1